LVVVKRKIHRVVSGAANHGCALWFRTRFSPVDSAQEVYAEC
jgi:hypothetical protein